MADTCAFTKIPTAAMSATSVASPPQKLRSLSPPNQCQLRLQRHCACGGTCEECQHNASKLQAFGNQRSEDPLEQEADEVADSIMRKAASPVSVSPMPTQGVRNPQFSTEALSKVRAVVSSAGRPMEAGLRTEAEAQFGHDLSHVRIHNDPAAAESAHEVDALAYTLGEHVVFGQGQYSPSTRAGQRLLAHELTHVLQQTGPRSKSNFGRNTETESLQRVKRPYIKQVRVHLMPPQNADLIWDGDPPADAAGEDHFTISTGKGYSDPFDSPGTCTRDCCEDADKQCAPPWDKPGKVGACCTYIGMNFYTGTPLAEHNGFNWWTPIQPYYSKRGIALHSHPEVTGEPIGHGCVRMEEPNAKRIFDYSRGRRTNVSIDGRAAPVQCTDLQQCGGGSLQNEGTGATEDSSTGAPTGATTPKPGLEGVAS